MLTSRLVRADTILHTFSDRVTIDDICGVFQREREQPFLPAKVIWDCSEAVLDLHPNLISHDLVREFSEEVSNSRRGSTVAIICAHDLQAQVVRSMIAKLATNSTIEVFTSFRTGADWLAEN